MRERANPQIHGRTHRERAMVLGIEVLDRIVGIVLKPDRSPWCRVGRGLHNGRAGVPDSVEVNIDLHNSHYRAFYMRLRTLFSAIVQFTSIDTTIWHLPARLTILGTPLIKLESSQNLPASSGGRRSRRAALIGALEGLRRALTIEFAPVRVNMSSPGGTDTPIWNSCPE